MARNVKQVQGGVSFQSPSGLLSEKYVQDPEFILDQFSLDMDWSAGTATATDGRVLVSRNDDFVIVGPRGTVDIPTGTSELYAGLRSSDPALEATDEGRPHYPSLKVADLDEGAETVSMTPAPKTPSIGGGHLEVSDPKMIGGRVFADHPDFMETETPAQNAFDYAVDNGGTILQLSQNENYGPLTIDESEFMLVGRASADTFRGSYVEDLVISSSRVRVEGVVGLSNNNSQAILCDANFTVQLNNVGAASDGAGSGSTGDILFRGSTAGAIVGGSRVNVTFDADATQCLADDLIRSSVTDNGTNNSVGLVTPP